MKTARLPLIAVALVWVAFVVFVVSTAPQLPERVATHFHGFLRDNFGTRVAGDNVEVFLRQLPDLPVDTARWVMGELQ